MCLVSHSFVYCVVVLVLKWYVLEFVLFMVVDNSLLRMCLFRCTVQLAECRLVPDGRE